ncbi:NifU family protein [Streptomyces sp. NPDC005931]|uniref:NifU family protein n=1 Tax=Streptomyces sp. NPDC005931 TaxID=3364737 RepID=UPI0036C04AD3
MIPLHPQPVAGRPDRLRWIVPAGLLSCTGRPAAVPEPLAALLTEGVLSRITVEAGAVVTRLGAGRSWRRDGPRVRSALHAALELPEGWLPGVPDGDTGGGPSGAAHDDGPPETVDDRRLYAAARDLLAGPTGGVARAHGGTIELVGVRDGIVTFRFGGACHGCPAAWFTLRHRLEHQLRRSHPGLREVRAVTAPPRTAVPAGGSRLGRVLPWGRGTG